MASTSDSSQGAGDGQGRITLADVEASFNNQVRNSFVVRHFGRPPANRITPFFYNRGWTANQMTSLRLALTGLALASLVGDGAASWALAAVLYYLVFVLDLVDGNLARLRDGATYWGRFYDGLVDRLFHTLSPLLAGIGVWSAGGAPWTMVAGAAATVLFLYQDLVRHGFQYYRLWMEQRSGPAGYRKGGAVAWAEAWLDRLTTNGFFIAPLLLLLPDGLNWFLLAGLLLQGLGGGLSLLLQLYVAYRTLLRGRKSKHAAGVDPQRETSPGLE
ncbi:MAG: CDP-alcohol phosphatidyltransferase family protein [Alphaproteobacteria bacterium]|jgi:phosphatidylglycerophosphate synthase|nr:CDP-alcohol phosphatidyltransferase family protein [Alphaproteobacteria bacterium]MDP6566264.1 CDP-alcohol phosphatidyltransferase family protein [Alphaproteobacteria bacterium]MDP6814656.1 CDP-alcohol phosphatidyltransferase family protein [Alphaproteobacteria bacterium]